MTLCVSVGIPIAQAELVIGQLGQTHSFDFQDFAGAGLQPGGGNGTLDSQLWSVNLFSDSGRLTVDFGDTATSGAFAKGVSPGSVTEVGVYAFETGGGNRILGFQIGPDGFAGAVPEIRLQNGTGQVIDQIVVQYEIWVRNDSNGDGYFDLEFSRDNTYIDPSETLFDSPLTADIAPAWVKHELQYQLVLPVSGNNQPLNPLLPGETIDIKWSIGADFDALNGYDEVGLDNLRITAFATAIPEPSATSLLASVVGLVVVTAARRRSARRRGSR